MLNMAKIPTLSNYFEILMQFQLYAIGKDLNVAILNLYTI